MSDFRELRRKDRAIDSSWAISILKKADFGILCTHDGSYPYGVPVNYFYEDGVIYIHSAKEGHKIDNIKANNKVCFVVVGSCQVIPHEFSTKYESVVVFGKAELLQDKDVIEPLRKIVQKYSSRYAEQAEKVIEQYLKATYIIKINIEHIQGKARN
ncbi:pyridoxamine 5'-phosphate oxidase family protein [Thermotoga profunda]|uniref:pyridoxamine 5'-phosphate oxidase family protein n=1 Tax=Thermotoga profunda TaxID=1508420 RepID=UPI0005974C8A|nr:pyridoxamine 5'-phosphate oxidase family protein [Thermotoga profunda]